MSKVIHGSTILAGLSLLSVHTMEAAAALAPDTAGKMPQKSTPPAQRPNIIYIMADDHAFQAISAYGSRLKEVMPTPNIDRLGREGARLDRCFVTNSISTPSRAVMLTGQYSHKNGVYTLNDALSPQKPTVAKMLQQEGYKTGLFGKWHLHSEPAGFDNYTVLPGQGRYQDPILICKDSLNGVPFNQAKGQVYPGHETDVVTNLALDFLEQPRGNQPFFLMCHFKAPHRTWIPAKRFDEFLKEVEIPEPGNLLDTYEGRNEYMKMLRMSMEHFIPNYDLKVERFPEGMDRDQIRQWAYQIYMKDYLRCIAGIDENVGRILTYLDQKGLTENTIVVYTSDQGFYLGEHGWFDKRLMYEESLRTPFLIRYPKEIKPKSVNDDITVNIDFAPTFLDYAGIPIPPEMQGKSIRKNLQGKTPRNWRKAMYYRYWMHDDPDHHVPAMYGLRTDRYRLTFVYGKALGKTGTGKAEMTPSWEFFDLKKDPSEMHDRYNDPAYKKEITRLKVALMELKKEYDDTDSNNPVMNEVVANYYW